MQDGVSPTLGLSVSQHSGCRTGMLLRKAKCEMAARVIPPNLAIKVCISQYKAGVQDGPRLGNGGICMGQMQALGGLC